MTPRAQTAPVANIRNVKVTLTSFLASVGSFDWYSVRTGTKAADMEPSANSSLRRFGILKATKKVSERPVAPK